ncbi:MAG: formyl transferase [Candidatus Lokiarchaeota archaeon]|nr:formyl transferase [Candidatus Lokiarchaeota archaeon]
MAIKPFYDYKKTKRPMNVAGFMSGSGTNIRKIIEHQDAMGERSPYKLIFLFSNVSDPNKCKIREIASEYNIEYKINDLKEFYEKKGVDRRNLKLRREYDAFTATWLKKRKIDAVALGGYMAIITDVIFKNFITINVHPADLSIIDPQSKQRKFTGDQAVRDAIMSGESELRSSVHIATENVDGGPLILISESIKVKLPTGVSSDDLEKSENFSMLKKISDKHQDKLKEKGDWVIFPLALEYIARGYIKYDESGILYFKDRPIPNGLKL